MNKPKKMKFRLILLKIKSKTIKKLPGYFRIAFLILKSDDYLASQAPISCPLSAGIDNPL
jgi:hypothetical protein